MSIGSHQMFPESWIYFGVLHFILVASVLGLAFIPLYRMNLAFGIALVGIGISVKLALFDQPFLNWIGLMTHKPITEDYVPMLPWFGALLIGMFFGKLIFVSKQWPAAVRFRADRAAGRLLAQAGRHGLLLYMAHQPIYLGALYLIIGNKV